MIRELVGDLALVVEAAKAVGAAAQAAGYDASVDLAVRRIDVAEKNAWMLRSHLE
jgi:starvation-inducible DNA-binding protein